MPYVPHVVIYYPVPSKEYKSAEQHRTVTFRAVSSISFSRFKVLLYPTSIAILYDDDAKSKACYNSTRAYRRTLVSFSSSIGLFVDL